MGLFIGAFDLRGAAITAGCERALLDALSRSDDRRQLTRRESTVVAHCIWPGAVSSLHQQAGHDLWLAGLPLLDHRSTADDAQRLCGAGADAEFDRLCAQAHGQFCAAQLIVSDGKRPRLRLATDRLGIRPLYYGEHQGVVYFATALRMLLAACPALGDEADLAGQIQCVTLGFALGATTPYRRIRSVAPGQVVQFDGDRTELRWAVDRAALARRRPPADEPALAATLAERFIEAVERRRGGSAPALAYLSGGLDSRCVVAALCRHHDEVHTINFAPAGSADLVLGRMAAQALGTRHYECTAGSPDFWARTVESVRRWREFRSLDKEDGIPEIATGFGGECLLAPTNIVPAMLESVAAGRPEDALRRFVDAHSNGIATRLFQPRWRKELPQLLYRSLTEELAACTGDDPARGLHLFVLMNEPRGQLAQHFEDLDLRRVEWQLPFFDREVVELALQLPTASLLRHRFYYRWLDQFGTSVSGVPWQAYPGSLPCPLPVPPGLRNQWADGWLDAVAHRRELRRLVQRVSDDLRGPRFPAALLDRRIVWLACLLTRMGSSRYEYLLRSAERFMQRSARSYS